MNPVVATALSPVVAIFSPCISPSPAKAVSIGYFWAVAKKSPLPKTVLIVPLIMPCVGAILRSANAPAISGPTCFPVANLMIYCGNVIGKVTAETPASA